MNKHVIIIAIAIALLLFSVTAHAESSDAVTAHAESNDAWDTGNAMVKKLQRGAVNAVTGWVEIPSQIFKGYKYGFMGNEKNKLVGIIAGTMNGVTHSVGRTLSGVADVVGFWAVRPQDNRHIGLYLDSENAWDKSEPRQLFEDAPGQTVIAPVIHKFCRGAGNVVLGITELPYQINKGLSDKSRDFGISKGLWYWLSREVSGITDIVTALVPTPEEPAGITFDEVSLLDRPYSE